MNFFKSIKNGIFFFVLFSVVISIVSYLIQYQVGKDSLIKEISEQSRYVFNQKRDYIQTYMLEVDNHVASLIANRTFNNFLTNPSVNDNFGHQAGNSVLIEVANIISKDIRKTDIAGRWGGEEFMIITPETNLRGATQLAEKVRREMENYRFKFVGHKTASFGVTEFREDDTIETLIQRADTNLYKAKNSGRNRVVST